MSDYHEDLLHDEAEWHQRRCEQEVNWLAADIMQFNHADEADEWIAQKTREILGSSDSGSVVSQWLREMLEEQGCIPEEVDHVYHGLPVTEDRENGLCRQDLPCVDRSNAQA